MELCIGIDKENPPDLCAITVMKFDEPGKYNVLITCTGKNVKETISKVRKESSIPKEYLDKIEKKCKNPGVCGPFLIHI